MGKEKNESHLSDASSGVQKYLDSITMRFDDKTVVSGDYDENGHLEIFFKTL